MPVVRRTLAATAALAAGALALTLAPSATATTTTASATARPDLGREVLGARDGWAAAEGGTTGGSAADADHVFHVRTWEEFRAALGGDAARGDTTARIVYVHGKIDANLRTPTGAVDCDAYEVDGFDVQDYVDAYAPEVWGTEAEPSGPLEDARAASAAVQEAQVRQHVGSNVTIVGVGRDAQITGAALTVRGSDNVIVRNLRLSDAYDCFTAWDPTDGDAGAWNAAYDNLWIAESTHVWVDHTTFDDGENPPSSLPEVYGVKFEVHDGLLDITNSADLVTASWNEFRDHDKTNLVGSSNSRVADRGKLRVTFHHNLWEDIGQRAPRVRYGDVHVYNNYYVQRDAGSYAYSWGVGVEAEIVAENNFFALSRDVDPAGVVVDWRGTTTAGSGLQEFGTLLNGIARRNRVSLVAAHNATSDVDIPTTVSWDPVLHERIHPTAAVPALVTAWAGSGRLR
ncbi:pectate lyase [Kineococcus glutinatus]|uniref:Polysaccharide lyase family 1 protein n=1 Tax=Kineococcus glutinatus TaxID=1070872 RepID=A0ABP9I3B0_9ACTN